MTTSSLRLRAFSERLLFVAAVCASAFLIFLVQPMVAKRILPWYGGAPAVWTLCLAFYQSALFLGYGYAHLLIRFAPPPWQLGVHALAVGVATLVLPVLPGDVWLPRDVANPTGRILLMLTANVALPFLVLASTGPLVQAWFARRHPRRSPYPLYAFSNAGSLAALLAYPFVIEPRFALTKTGDFWSFAFVGAACAVIGCAALAWRSRPSSIAAVAAGSEVGERAGFHTALWLLLSGCAVVLLMGITNELCVDVASVPFLWILPLATYLLTFVLCFASERTYRRAPYVILAAVAFLPSVGQAAWISLLEAPASVVVRSPPVQIASFCVLLFAGCMVLHGELYRLRPPPRALTAFYLCLSAGGALGGIFVGILAPAVFSDYYELEVGLGLASLLFLAAWAKDPASALHAAAPRWRLAATAGTAILLLGYAGWAIARPDDQLRHRERSFFGVYRVLEMNRAGSLQRRLKSGTTLHGTQLLREWRRLPTSYYGRASGVGLVMAPRRAEPGSRIGVIGLGIGTLASYARAGEAIRFYEIDPVVVRIARDDGHFTFLEDSLAETEVVVGDARLSLASEQARGIAQSFDYLVVDAFNSDAIPVHLLTVEAFVHYVRALAPEGLLAVHASNRHFDLMPLVTRVGLELGLHSLQLTNERVPRLQSRASQWVWLSRDPERIQQLERQVRRQQENLGLSQGRLQLEPGSRAKVLHVPVWTDDYSDLFGLLRRRGRGHGGEADGL